MDLQTKLSLAIIGTLRLILCGWELCLFNQTQNIYVLGQFLLGCVPALSTLLLTFTREHSKEANWVKAINTLLWIMFLPCWLWAPEGWANLASFLMTSFWCITIIVY